MYEGLLHGRIGVFDIQIVCSSHGFVAFRGFTDHNCRGAESDLYVRDSLQPQWFTSCGEMRPGPLVFFWYGLISIGCGIGPVGGQTHV